MKLRLAKIALGDGSDPLWQQREKKENFIISHPIVESGL
jgi:hypothetical protein